MSTLVEIEEAANRLSDDEKRELLMFVAKSLRSDPSTPPTPRKFSVDEMQSWIDEDERDFQA